METTTETLTVDRVATHADEIKIMTYTKRQKAIFLGSLAGLFVVFFLGKFIYNTWAFEETDDARTAANTSVLSSKVGGVVGDILVHENQKVKAGDALIRVDARDFQNRLDQMQAELGSVQATLNNAAKDNSRMKALLASDSVSVQQADGAQTRYQELLRKEASLKAQLKQAELDLDFTSIKAPTDGYVGRRSVEKGMVVGAGQPLLAFVQSTEYWVVANFKETQLQHMKIGQTVEVKVDAIADHVFEGKIESFAPGSGSTFAIIPPDNSTGNYVKVVQRVPVRIAISEENLKGFEGRFVPGLSVLASVKVR
jgi:membrane fusion protein (multidrug efflux system)